MLILTCDTSSRCSALALLDDCSLISACLVERAGEELVPAIDRLLKDRSMTLDDIELFAVIEGPGSFTGLRVGVNVMKTLAHLKNKPAIGVGSLQALAVTVGGCPVLAQRPLVPILHASQDQFYHAVYRPYAQDNFAQPILAPTLASGERLLQNLPARGYLFGLGVERLIEECPLPTTAEQTEWLVDTQPRTISPVAIAELALRDRTNAEARLKLFSQPRYLRLSAAQEKRQRTRRRDSSARSFG